LGSSFLQTGGLSNNYKSLVIWFLLAQIVTLSCAELKMQISFCAKAAASLAAAADALNLCTSFLQIKEEDCRKINNLLKYIG
jgi:hypothetical protein